MGVRQLAKAVGQFHTAGIQLEPLGDAGIIWRAAGQRGLGRRIAVKDRRAAMAQMRLDLLDQYTRQHVRPCVVCCPTDARPIKRRAKFHRVRLTFGVDRCQKIDPGVTISYIKEGACVHKLKLSPPKTVTGILTCKNPRCVTNQERIPNVTFYLVDAAHGQYACEYCDARTRL